MIYQRFLGEIKEQDLREEVMIDDLVMAEEKALFLRKEKQQGADWGDWKQYWPQIIEENFRNEWEYLEQKCQKNECDSE